MGIGRFMEAESEEDYGAGNRHGCGQHHPCLGWRQNWTHHHRWSIYLCVTSVCSWERKEKREMENERGKRIENLFIYCGSWVAVSCLLNFKFVFFLFLSCLGHVTFFLYVFLFRSQIECCFGCAILVTLCCVCNFIYFWRLQFCYKKKLTTLYTHELYWHVDSKKMNFFIYIYFFRGGSSNPLQLKN